MLLLLGLLLVMIVACTSTATDCTNFCAFQTNTPTVISMGNSLGTVIMSTDFQVKFEVLLSVLPTSNSEARNILEIKDASMGTSLLKIGITSTRSLRLQYNDAVRSYYSALVPTTFASSYTTVIAGFRDGYAYLSTSNDFNYVDSVPIDNPLVPGLTEFTLFSSGTYDEANPSASGFIQNIQITGTVSSYHLKDAVPAISPFSNI